MADDLLKFDFGFTAVDESELEAVQQISTKASSTEAEVKVLEDKLNNLYNAILPLLSNLKKNPEKITQLNTTKNENYNTTNTASRSHT